MHDGKTASISAESWIVHQAVLQQEAEVKDQGRNNFVCFNNVGMSNVSAISLISKKLSPFPPQMAPKAKFIFTPRTLISLNDLVMVRLILVSDGATLQKKKKQGFLCLELLFLYFWYFMGEKLLQLIFRFYSPDSKKTLKCSLKSAGAPALSFDVCVCRAGRMNLHIVN